LGIDAYAPAHDPAGDELAEDEGGEARDEAQEAVGQGVDGPGPEHAAVWWDVGKVRLIDKLIDLDSRVATHRSEEMSPFADGCVALWR
jgi:hypothetical protein